ncbi:unnamed protein product [Chrysoparadoxa australica]
MKPALALLLPLVHGAPYLGTNQLVPTYETGLLAAAFDYNGYNHELGQGAQQLGGRQGGEEVSAGEDMHSLGWLQKGDWFSYTVLVTAHETQSYQVEYELIKGNVPQASSMLHMVDNSDCSSGAPLAPLDAKNIAASYKFYESSTRMTLTPGKHILTVCVEHGGGANLKAIRIWEGGPPAAAAPAAPPAPAPPAPAPKFMPDPPFPNRQKMGVTLTETGEFSLKTQNYKISNENTLLNGQQGEGMLRTPTKIIENEYVKLTLTPELGGRILSMIYKPTNHEMLYVEKEVAAPYGMTYGVFWWDYLMVVGGIYPTFPTAEHGKFWNLPWSWKVLENGGEMVKVQMEMTDDQYTAPIGPESTQTYGHIGATGLTCRITIGLRKDSSAVEYHVEIFNDSGSDVANYEYWTCMLIAPGSNPDDPVCPVNSEIIVKAEHIELRDDPEWWAWMRGAEERDTRPEYQGNKGKFADDNGPGSVYLLNNLRHFENWENQGIAYTYPQMESDFWGVINHDNEEGLMRVADNSVTIGMKWWLWGATQSFPEDRYQVSERPYIELWGGVTQQFFKYTSMANGARKEWTEYFLTTLGISDVTTSNENGSLYLEAAAVGNDGKIKLKCQFFGTRPGALYAMHFFKDNEEIHTHRVFASVADRVEDYEHIAEAGVIASGDTLRVTIEGYYAPDWVKEIREGVLVEATVTVA